MQSAGVLIPNDLRHVARCILKVARRINTPGSVCPTQLSVDVPNAASRGINIPIDLLHVASCFLKVTRRINTPGLASRSLQAY